MKKKVSILFAPAHYVLDAKNSGSEFSWAFSIYKSLSANKNFITIFITGGIRGLEDKNVFNLHLFDPGKLNLSVFRIMYFYIQIFISGMKINKKENIDIIHHILPFHIGHTFNLLPIFLKKKFIIGPVQSPLTITDTDLSTKDARGFEKSEKSLLTVIEENILQIISFMLGILSRYTLKKADKIIVINETTKELLVNIGVKLDRIVIIPPGINVGSIKHISRKNTSSTIHIITVGYLLKRKGVDLIIRALKQVTEKNKNIVLHIVGDGPQMQSLQQLVKSLKLEEFVIFHGFIPQSEITSYYQKASIFINMSKSEGFATVCLEAMASGLAIISSKVGGFNDAITDGENGFLVNQGDYKELGKRIEILVNNKSLIKQMGQKARKDAEKYYDWESVIIPKYVAIYERA